MKEVTTPPLQYQEATSQALCGFQLIEEGLKTYIQIYHNAVRAHLPPELTYKYSGADVQGAALGKLVNVFSKISSRADLVEQLRSLTKSRDELAHSAYLQMLGAAGTEPRSLERVAEFRAITVQITAILLEIAAEIALVLSHSHSKPVTVAKPPET